MPAGRLLAFNSLALHHSMTWIHFCLLGTSRGTWEARITGEKRASGKYPY